MYSICVAERGTIVLRRVRIMIGGVPWGAPVMIPSSVGSLDIAISDRPRRYRFQSRT
jgi:hypothetical protein